MSLTLFFSEKPSAIKIISLFEFNYYKQIVDRLYLYIDSFYVLQQCYLSSLALT